jgi:hypothetical protein
MLTLASVSQLPLMVVIVVGQGLLGRKQELQAEEQYKTTCQAYQDVEDIKKILVELKSNSLPERGGHRANR